MDRVLPGLVVPELQREEGVFAPGNIGVHVDLVEILRQMGEPLPAHRSQVHLGPGGQVDVPEFRVAGHLGGARQLVGGGAQEVAADNVPEGPAAGAVLGHADLELAAGILLLALAGHVAEGVHG